MERDTLEAALAAAFDADETDRRVVSRQARDLADAGLLAEDLDVELTSDLVVEELRDAPEDHSLIERWNWWLDSLELSHGGYHRFKIRADLQ